MRYIFKNLVIAGAGAFLTCAAPASAAVFACAGGNIDLTADQCVASGNDHLADVEAAIAAATGANVGSLQLALYGKSDDNAGLFSFPPDGVPINSTVTDWTVLDGTLIKYVTIKGSNNFKIYELAGLGASSGSGFSTVGILNGGGRTPNISHLSFWTAPGGAAVPEPATWAMMIIGFGLMGLTMRGRKGVTALPRANSRIR